MSKGSLWCCIVLQDRFCNCQCCWYDKDGDDSYIIKDLLLAPIMRSSTRRIRIFFFFHNNTIMLLARFSNYLQNQHLKYLRLEFHVLEELRWIKIHMKLEFLRFEFQFLQVLVLPSFFFLKNQVKDSEIYLKPTILHFFFFLKTKIKDSEKTQRLERRGFGLDSER